MGIGKLLIYACQNTGVDLINLCLIQPHFNALVYKTGRVYTGNARLTLQSRNHGLLGKIGELEQIGVIHMYTDHHYRHQIW
ncbi:hypothetical protein EVA_15312 [gut metagenome]|uniref:Uncharacterized protein n=1 Tax=gut metagenome TaxID=749906 RepID=J9C9M7_9ZZZZ